MASLNTGGGDTGCKVASDEAREASRNQTSQVSQAMLRGLVFILRAVGSHGRL